MSAYLPSTRRICNSDEKNGMISELGICKKQRGIPCFGGICREKAIINNLTISLFPGLSRPGTRGKRADP